jgi:hypothetical protein
VAAGATWTVEGGGTRSHSANFSARTRPAFPPALPSTRFFQESDRIILRSLIEGIRQGNGAQDFFDVEGRRVGDGPAWRSAWHLSFLRTELPWWAGEPYGLVKKVTVPVPRLPVLFCTAVMAAW